MPIELFFTILWISLILTRSFMSAESNSSPNNLSVSLILPGWWSAGCKYQTKHYLNHSLSSKFWILIKPFLDGLILLVIWYNCCKPKGCTLKY